MVIVRHGVDGDVATSRSSAASTSRMVVTTARSTAATHRRPICPRTTSDRHRRGTTCSSYLRAGGRRRRVHVSGAVGGPHPARHPQPVASGATPCCEAIADATELPPERAAPEPCGACAVQVLRTYPWRDKQYPFAREGSAASRAPTSSPFGARAGSSTSRTSTSGRSPRPTSCAPHYGANPICCSSIVIPRYPDPDGAIARRPRARSAASRCRTRCTKPAATGSPSTTSRTKRDARLRALEGVRRRRHLDGGGIRQPEPSLVDARLGNVVRGHRHSPRRARRREMGAGDDGPDLARDMRVRLACEHIGLDAGRGRHLGGSEGMVRRDAASGRRAGRRGMRTGASGPVPRAPAPAPAGARRARPSAGSSIGCTRDMLDPDGRPGGLKPRSIEF